MILLTNNYNTSNSLSNVLKSQDNIFKEDEKGDSLLHIIVQNGSINVYRFIVGLLIRINKKCDNVIGKIDFEKSGTKNYAPKSDSLSDISDNEDDSVKKAKEDFQRQKFFCDIDGEIATTDDGEGESDCDQSETIQPNQEVLANSQAHESLGGHNPTSDSLEVNYSPEECEILRNMVLDLFSHQNNKGNTILHEAVLEDRHNFLENIKCLQMVRQNIKNKKDLTFDELKDYLCINSFIRRYQNIENEIKNRVKKKRYCRFFDSQDDEEESMSIIKMQKILTPEERRNNEMRALMWFVYLFIFLLAVFVAYLFIKSMYSRSRTFFPPPKLM